MTGSRILAIYFGSSIYVWGAIIGVFLAALSIGYYSGGMLADRLPSFYPLNAFLLIAGGWLMLIPFYANSVCRLLLRFNPGGGGGGIGARKFVNDDPNVVVDLVEIDERVVDLGLKYFHLEPSERLRIHVEDGRGYVRRSQTKYDLVILDAFTIGGQIPFHLTTREFFDEIKQTLSPDGVVLANINGTMRGRRSRIMRSEYKTLATVFPNVYLFPYLHETERGQNGAPDQDRSRNLILIAVNGGGSWTKESILATATKLEESKIAITPTFLEDAKQFFDARLPTDDVPLLTDDYAPVDTMVF